jgi:hypothetical protein
VIPDEFQRAAGPVLFRDADGCRVYPGTSSWASDDDGLPGDGRVIHEPLVLGVVGQFELSYDCYAEQVTAEASWEEHGTEGFLDLPSLALDPLVGELAAAVLERNPSDGGEIAFEVDA